MITITKKITDRFENITTLEALADFLNNNNLETKISCLGQRVVTNYKYEGSMPLKQISQFASELIKRTTFRSPYKRNSAWNNSIIPIIRKIDLLYKENNQQIEAFKKTKSITSIFIALRNFCCQAEDIEWENIKPSREDLKYKIPVWKRTNGRRQAIY